MTALADDLATLAGIRFNPYSWGGKTYKSLRGLGTAIFARHPGCSYSFDADAMIVRIRATGERIIYAVERTPDCNKIASEPTKLSRVPQQLARPGNVPISRSGNFPPSS